jgi:hypothetical protein
MLGLLHSLVGLGRGLGVHQDPCGSCLEELAASFTGLLRITFRARGNSMGFQCFHDSLNSCRLGGSYYGDPKKRKRGYPDFTHLGNFEGELAAVAHWNACSCDGAELGSIRFTVNNLHQKKPRCKSRSCVLWGMHRSGAYGGQPKVTPNAGFFQNSQTGGNMAFPRKTHLSNW